MSKHSSVTDSLIECRSLALIQLVLVCDIET